MNRLIKYISIIILIVIMLVILCGCTNSISKAETEEAFVKISDEGSFDIYYHKKTKVMYVVSDGFYSWGVATLLVNAEGKPLLYEEK